MTLGFLVAITMLAFALAIIVALAMLLRTEREDRHRERVAMSATHSRELAWIEKQYSDASGWYARELETRSASYAEALFQTHERHDREIERLTNLLTVGTPARPEAIVTEQAPDAESRLIKQISEDSITAGISRLKDEYRQIGVLVSDEEVRDEVIAMLMGNQVKPNPDRTLPVKE